MSHIILDGDRIQVHLSTMTEEGSCKVDVMNIDVAKILDGRGNIGRSRDKMSEMEGRLEPEIPSVF